MGIKRKAEPIVDKIYSKETLGLCFAGLVTNIVLSHIIMAFDLPFYLDNVGSVLVGALGGVLPGIVVGFLSNVIGSYSNPISLYYAVITVVIAYLAAEFSERGYFKSWWGRLKILPYYVFWGGCIGSIFTWFLYGSEISGLAAPYATVLNKEYGLTPFLSQLLVDIVIDVPDKFMTIFLAGAVLNYYPKALYDKFPLSYLYDRPEKRVEEAIARGQENFRIFSLENRLVKMLITYILIIAVAAVGIGTVYHHKRLSEVYGECASSVVKTGASLVDGNKLDTYLQEGTGALGYKETEQNLYKLREFNKLVKYIFVYKLVPGGCKVVFDLDNKELPADPIGTYIPLEKVFNNSQRDFDAGHMEKPVFSHGPYGYIMTAFAPVKNARGETIAYVGADIGMEAYMTDMLTYIIQIVALIFALTIIMGVLALWYVKREVTAPINSIINLVNKLDTLPPGSWLKSSTWKERKEIRTGDEIETLYNTTCRLEANISHYVNRITETEQQLEASKELERVNKELAEAIEKADEATKVKSEFYSRMSHDMRTPMNGIIGLVHLSKNEENSAVLRENMEKIGTSSNYLLGLINDTLDMSKMESKKLTLAESPIYLEPFAENIYTMLKPSLEAKKLQYDFSWAGIPEDQVVLGDEMRLKQVFMNLLSNAIKFTPNHGYVKVYMERESETEDGVVDKITFSDNGIGMSREFIRKSIFSPFSQERNAVTREYAGTGLGLAIVKNLVETKGGHIEVKSEQGEGTTFVVHLPFKKATPEDLKSLAEKEKTKEIGYSILGGKKVLVVEDHPLNTEIVLRLLRKKGMEVVTAENGKEGVATFTKAPEGFFDLILMDIRMPIMDGLEAARTIRSLDRADAQSIPIIAMTANAFAEDIAASKAAGMNAHLAKPINPKLLYTTMAVNLGASYVEK